MDDDDNVVVLSSVHVEVLDIDDDDDVDGDNMEDGSDRIIVLYRT